MALILASSSPRRHQLLRNAGISFEVRPAHLNEDWLPGESAEEYVRRLAEAKALEVARSAPTGTVVLAADTAVEINGEILGKPLDAADAARMLRLLSGTKHRVLTGVCVASPPGQRKALEVETTVVTFRSLADDEIQDYIASGEPLDKAGGYGVQGLASKFVTRIEGCYFNVVGLPVALVDRLIKS